MSCVPWHLAIPTPESLPNAVKALLRLATAGAAHKPATPIAPIDGDLHGYLTPARRVTAAAAVMAASLGASPSPRSARA